MIEYTDGIGIAAVRSIKRLAARDDGPERTKNTWNSIKNGLQLSDEEEFSIVDMVKLEKAWNAYEAYGVAPSKKLQPWPIALALEYGMTCPCRLWSRV